VRNRWKRLKEEADAAALRRRNTSGGVYGGSSDEGCTAAIAASSNGARAAGCCASASAFSARPAAKRPSTAAQPPPKRPALSRTTKTRDEEETENGQRVSWSPHEDQVIVRAVQELGPRWCSVAARLPSRTDQAVRNRWNRLQQRARVQARTMLNAFQVRSAAGGAAGSTPAV